MFDSTRSFADFEPFLNSEQAAALVKVHPKTLQRLARNGRVVGYRVGKLWRFHASDLEGRHDSFSSTLDSDTAQRYALSTTCARN